MPPKPPPPPKEEDDAVSSGSETESESEEDEDTVRPHLHFLAISTLTRLHFLIINASFLALS